MSAISEIAGSLHQEPLPGLWFNEGVYYAEIKHPAVELPIRVALHGISSPREACQAASALARRECRLPPQVARS